MTALPTGTVTFLFTDMEGSTSLARKLGPDWPAVLETHNQLLVSAIGEHGGAVVQTEGDAVFAVFASAVDAVAAAAAAQKSLAGHRWPAGVSVRVRMGLHTGEGTRGGADYVGLDVHRAARIAGAGHGGQVLLSDSTQAVIDGSLPAGLAVRDLGLHRLKDFDEPRNIHQLDIDGLTSEFRPLKTLEGAHNLPLLLTSFVGRERELAEIKQLLDSARFVTLTGPGGTGKTRIGLRAAFEVKDRFPDGAYFVDLAPITDPGLVPSVIGSTIDIGKEGQDPVLETLKTHLRDKDVLLVLDNFEQIIEAAPVVGELLLACPRLKLIVTSREPLHIAGEQEFSVPALGLPEKGASEPDELRTVDSVALFLERAAAVRPGFELRPDNAAAIAGICARLDGLPLGLELAAARIKLFEPADLLARLGPSLSLLAGGRDLTERQRTLRGAIQWSYDLLSEAEQATFRGLSVFAAGCSLEAAEAVCLPGGAGFDLLEVISSLHDKSLVRRQEGSAGGLRIMMLQTIREYAAERLEASGEGEELRRRRAQFYVEVAQRARETLSGPEQQQWLGLLDPDLDNFRAVIRWAIDTREVDTGLRVAASLNWFWLLRNHTQEGRRLLEELLALEPEGPESAARAAGLAALADLAGWQGDYEVSRPIAERALEAFRKLGDMAGVGDQLSNMGYAAAASDPSTALDLFRQSIEAYRRAGAPPQMGQSLIGLALPEMQLRKTSEASEHLKQALTVFHQAGDSGGGTLGLIAAGLLGVCARLEGNLEKARESYVDVLLQADRLGVHMALTLPLSALADLALLEGRPERAAVLDAAQAQLAERLGGTPSFQLMGIPKVADRARAELGDERYEQAAAIGRQTALEEIIRLAVSSGDEEFGDRLGMPACDPK